MFPGFPNRQTRPDFSPQIHVTFDPVGFYAVEGLKPDTLYRFSLAARSEMGLGVYTQPIEARTAQSSKSAFPPGPRATPLIARRFLSWQTEMLSFPLLTP